jgi:hypothetical protein
VPIGCEPVAASRTHPMPLRRDRQLQRPAGRPAREWCQHLPGRWRNGVQAPWVSSGSPTAAPFFRFPRATFERTRATKSQAPFPSAMPVSCSLYSTFGAPTCQTRRARRVGQRATMSGAARRAARRPSPPGARADHLVPEERLGRRLVGVGDGLPASAAIPARVARAWTRGWMLSKLPNVWTAAIVPMRKPAPPRRRRPSARAGSGVRRLPGARGADDGA